MKELVTMSSPEGMRAFAGQVLPQLRKYNLFVFMLLVPTLAHADLIFGDITIDPSNSPGTQFNGGTNAITGSTSDSGCGTGSDTKGCGSYKVTHGSMGLGGSASNSYNVFVEGDFQDSITINAGSAANGTTAMLSFGAGIEGSLSASGLGSNAGFTLQAEVGIPLQNSAFQIDHTGTQFGNPAKGFEGDPLGTYFATVPIQIGVPEALWVRGLGEAHSSLISVSDPGEAAAFELANTVFWGGIQQVTINGVPISFTVTSRSGTNYLQSFQGLDTIPEPADSWVLAAGVPIAWWIRRRSQCRSKRRRILLIPLVATLVPFLAHASAIANLHVDVSASPSFGNQCPGVPCFTDQIDKSTPISITGSASGATTHAEVADGSIKLSGTAGPGSQSSQFGSFTDILTVFAPGVADGTPGSLTFSVFVDESLSVMALGRSFDSADWNLQASYWGGTISRGGKIDTVFNTTYVGDPTGTYTETVPFLYGVAESMSVRATAGATDMPPIGGRAGDDLSHSIYWGGISDVMANGAPVSSFTVTSDSGTDWSQSFIPTQTSVPEPRTGVWLFGAFGGIWLARRHLKKRLRTVSLT